MYQSSKGRAYPSNQGSHSAVARLPAWDRDSNKIQKITETIVAGTNVFLSAAVDQTQPKRNLLLYKIKPNFQSRCFEQDSKIVTTKHLEWKWVKSPNLGLWQSKMTDLKNFQIF